MITHNEPLLPLDAIGTFECSRWRNALFRRFKVFRSHLENHYRWLATQHSYVEANRWLGATAEKMKLGGTGLTIDADQQAVSDYAKAKSKACEKLIHDAYRRVGTEGMLLLVRNEVNRTGISFPLPEDKEPTKEQKVAALARLCDFSWWRRKLITWQSRELEAFARELGFVCRKTGAYISNISFARRSDRKRSNRALLEKLQAENELGQTYTLAELADLSVSNPAIRRTELMVRMRGFENIANEASEQFTGQFCTLTCPSKYHARSKSGIQNSKYNGATPLEAQHYLNTVWQRTRAAWKRQGIEAFGMRVVEPHHDGTPHWHLLLFFESTQVAPATAILQGYALEEDGEEPGASEHRLQVVTIDPSKGSATGYIAKYISKNIDGYGIDADQYGLDAKNSAQRIEAWASVWGIRQFQQIGGASVTVWRELRRLDAETIDASLLAQLIQAADNGEWDHFTELMGGAICPRNERPVRPMYLAKAEENRYGEIIQKLNGLFYCSSQIVTRLHTWVISKVATTSHEANIVSVAPDGLNEFDPVFSFAPEGRTWSSVNNCTGN